MLSPCDYHLSVPRGWAANLRFRLAALDAADRDAAARRALAEACRDDFLFFVNAFCWQYNPKRKGVLRYGPFTTFPVQEECAREVLWCIDHDEDLVIEKSREMGASWLMVYLIVWLLLFRPGEKVILVSKDEPTVKDRADPMSLFWKVSHTLANLPGWLRGDVRETKNTYSCPASGSTVTGVASTGTAGVADRASVMFIDEFTLIREDIELFKGTASTAACRVFNGTHRGIDTKFYHLLYDEGATIRRLRMHWTQHPEKAAGAYRWDPVAREIVYLDAAYRHPPDYPFARQALPAGGFAPGVRSPWYDKECRRLEYDSRAIAEEQDIDPRAAKKQVFDGLMVADLTRAYARRPVWEGDAHVDEAAGSLVRLVPGVKGPLRLWFDPAGGPPAWAQGQAIEYGAGSDVSRGQGATPSTISVGNTLGYKVAEYVNRRIEPKPFGALLVALCRWFAGRSGQGAAVAWECPGPGVEVSQVVLKLGYRNIYWRRKREGDAYAEEQTGVPGWWNHMGESKALALLVNEYRVALETRWLVNPSREAMDETLNFQYTSKGLRHQRIKTKVDPSAEGEGHGDIVVADALMWLMLKDRVTAKPGEKPAADPHYASLEFRRQLAVASARDEAYHSWD